MPRTRIDLANRALEKLMIVGSGQSPDAEDTAKANGIIDAMAGDLASRNIYTIPDLADIDLAAFEWLADFLGFMIAPDFGRPQDEGLRQRAEYMLRRQTNPPSKYERVVAVYY